MKTPLIDVLFAALDSEMTFDEAVDCLCAMFRETREVDDSTDVIEALYPRLISLRHKVTEAAEAEDLDMFKGYTRLFAEAGEAWVILIARMPTQFRDLVLAIEQCARLDEGRDVISLTFNFWYDMKNYLVLGIYDAARRQYTDVFHRLVDIMINHLEYPHEKGQDLFHGDREYEEKFREFRHAMGDVLKDCCEVVGAADCLNNAFVRIMAWMEDFNKQSPEECAKCHNWQKLEAPLFSLRAMGRMVTDEEEVVLPQLMATLVQLPEHEKVRFAATLVLGRYTEWTSKHPEFLEMQMKYIINGFQHGSKDVAQAAAMALKYFCQDCGKLLADNIAQLHSFYEQVSPSLPIPSLYEITDGVAHVVSSQPLEKIHDALVLFCSPIAERLMQKANAATDKNKKCRLADEIQLLTIFAQVVHPLVPEGRDNPMIQFWQRIVGVMSTILDGFVDFLPICEQVGRFYRALLISYRTAMLPLLPEVANKLTTSFEKSHQGIFLWVSGTVIREFGDEEFTSLATRNSVYQFLEQQCLSMFRLLNVTRPQDIPDGSPPSSITSCPVVNKSLVVEDFFRFLADGIMFHPSKIIMSNLLEPIIEASLVALALEQPDPLLAVLQFLRDLFAYGREAPPNSTYHKTPPEVQSAIKAAAASTGERITQCILSGLMYSFPNDCVTDSSGVILELVELVPQPMIQWVKSTLELLPPGSVTSAEAQKFVTGIETAAKNKDWNKIRYTFRDFTAWYRRKNASAFTQHSETKTC